MVVGGLSWLTYTTLVIHSRVSLVLVSCPTEDPVETAALSMPPMPPMPPYESTNPPC